MRRPRLMVVAALLATGCAAGSPDRSAPPTSAYPEAGAEQVVAHRAAHTLTTLPDGRHLVAGGCDVDGCATGSGSAFLLGPDGAVPTGNLVEARDGHTATLLADGDVLVAGGFSGEGRPPLASAEVYDGDTGTWRSVGDLALGRGGHAAAPLGDGRVIVAGGWVGSGARTSTTEIYDPATGRFTPGPDLPVAVDGLATTPLRDGSVLVVGGTPDGGRGSSTSVRIGGNGSVEPVDDLGTARFKHTAVLLPSGEALVLGGTTDDRHLLRSTEVFDPATSEFRAGPDLVSGRYKLSGSAAVLPDGRVVVAGGGPGLEVVDVDPASAEVVDAAGADWASFSTVGVARGRLVVVGGYDRDIRLTDTNVDLALGDL
jgi:Galactose oxidase, central domain/Kelch motif